MLSHPPLTLLLLVTALRLPAGELLHNGIALPAAWPPNHHDVSYDAARRDPAICFVSPMPVDDRQFAPFIL